MWSHIRRAWLTLAFTKLHSFHVAIMISMMLHTRYDCQITEKHDFLQLMDNGVKHSEYSEIFILSTEWIEEYNKVLTSVSRRYIMESHTIDNKYLPLFPYTCWFLSVIHFWSNTPMILNLINCLLMVSIVVLIISSWVVQYV